MTKAPFEFRKPDCTPFVVGLKRREKLSEQITKNGLDHFTRNWPVATFGIATKSLTQHLPPS